MSRKVINIVGKSNKQLDLFNLNLDEGSTMDGHSETQKEFYPLTMTVYNEIINSNEIIVYLRDAEGKKGVRCFKSNATFDNKIYFSGVSDVVIGSGGENFPDLITMLVTVESNQLIVEAFLRATY